MSKVGELKEASRYMLEALKNLENDNNSIPKPIWDMVKEAIKKGEALND